MPDRIAIFRRNRGAWAQTPMVKLGFPWIAIRSGAVQSRRGCFGSSLRDLLAHEAATFEAVFDELRRYYDRVRPKYLAHPAVDAEVVMPASPDVETFGRLFDLRTVAVQPSSRDGVAFITYLFSSDWEAEHGIGVVAHRREVITIGGGSDLMFWSPPDE